jgi:myo-inositol 2-dehydrogenase / D-chiro-inositol 1-dehydrogenase
MTTSNHPTIDTSRRGFLKATAAVAAAAHLSAPAVHAAGSDIIKVGLIGCGGRGTGAALQALAADSNTELVAIGDAFADRAQLSLAGMKKRDPERVKVTADTCFSGLDAYKNVIDSGAHVVLMCEPPGFRPKHLEYAVAAGKHIFAEKPMAVDAPGVRALAKTVEEAGRKKLALVAGFNGRYTYSHRAIFERIHEGAIGDIIALYTTFNTGGLWNHGRKPEWSDMEWQIRNWYYFTWLSGDHLVEQAVHNVDRISWAMKEQMPSRAVAFGGRQVRTSAAYGHIFDHFSVVYEWESGTRAFLFCRQQDGCAMDISDRVMGSRGTALGGRAHAITGEHPWKYTGPANSGHQTEHDELFASIRAGKPINDGQRMINSTLMAIMGRMAAYSGQVITWDQAMNSKEDLMPEKLEWGPIATPPVAMPGRTRFF